MKNLKVVPLFIILALLTLRIVNTSSFSRAFSDVQALLHPPRFTELASLYGHPAETHYVTTEDGYILTMFRLPGNRRALPILLFHGLCDSSDTWIIRGNTSLSITLANQGYDVWLGNARGNRYSMGHLSLNPNVDSAYWNYTFDEHGLYDLPATVDYILNYTNASKLNMFGHSQGTTMMWVLLSTRTEYNDKINVATALAPVAYVKYVLPPLSRVTQIVVPLYPVLRALGVTSVLRDDSTATIAFRVISRIPVIGYMIDGYDILFSWFGLDSSELEPGFLPTVADHVPTSTSLKNIIHWGQATLSGQFSRFDYGKAGNRAAYNSSTPPIYPLGRIRTKVVLLAALNDKVSQLPDLENLRWQLPNVVMYVINPRLVMNHLDYVWGRTAPDYLYTYIFEVLRRYGN